MEIFRALAALAEPPTKETARLAETLELGAPPSVDEHTEVFVFQLYPYASVYLGREGMLGGEARDRVAGFWRALGQTPPAEPDHLALVVALYARLAELEAGETERARREGWRGARASFLWEHVLSWLPVYLSKLAEIAPPFYRRWADVLARALAEESREILGETKETDATLPLPVHLREATGLVDPREGGVEEFLQSLLAPARSGMILTRSDLGRAARRFGLGLRLGERRFILKSLLAQDAEGMSEWLAAEARGWARRHQAMRAAHGVIAEAWEKKAAASATLIAEARQK